MTDTRAPLTAQEIEGLREWATDEKTRAARYRLLNEPELPSEVYLRRVLRALDELEALRRERDEFRARAERAEIAQVEEGRSGLRARLATVIKNHEHDLAKLRDALARIEGANDQ